MRDEPVGATHSPDYPWLMAAIAAVCAAGAGSAIWPAVEHTLTVAVIAVPLAAVVGWALRREARIRRRLADTTGHPPGGPVRRVGPGDQPPAPPAPTTSTSTSTSDLPRVAATAGRAIDSTGAPS